MAILQSLLKAHKPAAAPERAQREVDPTLARRKKFADAIADQINLIANPELTKTKRARRKVDGKAQQVDATIKIKSWVHADGDHLLLVPRYGHAYLTFAPGKTALLVTQDKIADILKQLSAACAAGELDQLLEAASASARPKRKSTKAAA